MGRPPIGDHAMTAAEKQRRYRAKKFGNSSSVTKPRIATAERQKLEARIRELEAELTRERAASKRKKRRGT